MLVRIQQILRGPKERVAHLFVDEAQDLSPIELAALIGRYEPAARLFAATEAIRTVVGYPQLLPRRVDSERFIATLREFQSAGKASDWVDRRRIEIRPVSIFFVIAPVEVPPQVQIQSKF